ncbi:FAD-dependent oxidoreductase [Microvirga thermotolerans]|uniref:FAD-dependent oxidoreductase n=1 Tax=Microvirga thermotolerans TaxID=2651334 RepID=A0A5P9JZH3_9HYPH|nr:FAD-dependent oxidoreductase [Microvirga thermotolerans]QFU16665.1 FAD-dependent oxidoreductase [Microvirga thermotolerans]
MKPTKSVTCDVLVVGSGAGGFSTALTARLHGLDVIIAEKEPVFGGTTARSGGWMWIPCNPLAQKEGFKDSREAARTYLQHEAGNHFDAARVDAFLENGPKMVEFFQENTEMDFTLGPAFSDYHPDAPGGTSGGRSIVATPYDGRRLGKEIARLRPPLREITFLGMMIGSGKELLHFFNVTRSVKSAAYVGVLLAKYARDLVSHGRAMRLTNGNALIGRLAKSAIDQNIPIWTSSPVKDLIVENGAVKGALVETEQGIVEVRTRCGVVLAAGGFPQDVLRRKELFPHAPTGAEHWSPAPPGNTGDGIRLGERVGGRAAEGLPNAAAWVPVSLVPRRDGTHGPFPHFIDRGKPGVIAVTKRGKRFTNESNSYHDFVQAMVSACGDDPEKAAWLIVDHPTIRRYGLGFVKPFPVPLAPYLQNGYLLKGRTLRELAAKAGIDPAALGQTVETYNRDARRGEDPQFRRGSTAYNRYLGDPDHKPNPCVGPIERGPFYAVKVVPGDLGTFAGLKTDADARVVDANGQAIPGLYAVGNDMASIMGGNYPGGGITLGPAMTFGYIAGRHLAGVGTQDRPAADRPAA